MSKRRINIANLFRPRTYSTEAYYSNGKTNLVCPESLRSLSPEAFGGRLKTPPHVALVATHADIVNLPRSAGGEFQYEKDTSLLKEIRNR